MASKRLFLFGLMSEDDIQSDDEVAGKEFSWTVHPVAERPWQGVLLIGIIGFCTWLFWSGFGQFYGIFCLVVLLLAMAQFFIPTRYDLDEEGIEITSFFVVRHFRPWSDYRNFYDHKIGAHLTTFRRPSRLDAFRGNFIRFAPGNRKQVLAYLDEYIKRRIQREEAEDET